MMTRIVLGGHGFKVRAKIINVWLQTLRGLRVDVCPEADHISELIEWLGCVRSGLVLACQNSTSDAYQRLFESARARAFERLGNDRHKATDYEIGLVIGVHARHRESLEIWRQMDRDLRIYPLYDALAMWMGSETGLAAAVPEMMAEVAELFL